MLYCYAEHYCIPQQRNENRKIQLSQMRDTHLGEFMIVFQHLDPGINFTNALLAAFTYVSFSHSFFVLAFQVCTLLAQDCWRKSFEYKIDEIELCRCKRIETFLWKKYVTPKNNELTFSLLENRELKDPLRIESERKKMRNETSKKKIFCIILKRNACLKQWFLTYFVRFCNTSQMHWFFTFSYKFATFLIKLLDFEIIIITV